MHNLEQHVTTDHNTITSDDGIPNGDMRVMGKVQIRYTLNRENAVKGVAFVNATDDFSRRYK